MILNNIKAVGIHICVVCMAGFAFFPLGMDWVTSAILCDILYIALGYVLLKPVDKNELLSVSSVFIIVLVELFIALSTYGEGDEWWSYLIFNPSGNTISILFQVMFQSDYGCLTSAIVPPLLMYVGLRMKHKKISHQESNVGNEKQDEMVYYDVPQNCILLNEVEQLLIGKDVETEGWIQINFTMQYGKHFGFLKDSSKVPINSAEFLIGFLWELRSKDEVIEIKIWKHMDGHAPTEEIRLCETRDVFVEELQNLILDAPMSCIRYRNNDGMQRAILFEAGEMLNFFLKPAEHDTIKTIMAKYADETEYYKYEAGLD